MKNIIAWSLCLFLMVGVTFSGYSAVLCIDENGRMEVETVCTPCCTGGEDVCGISSPEKQNQEHSDCANCSDVELDSPLWSKRPQKSEFIQLVKTTFYSPVTICNSSNSFKQNSLYQIILDQSLNQIHPTELSSTILIC